MIRSAQLVECQSPRFSRSCARRPRGPDDHSAGSCLRALSLFCFLQRQAESLQGDDLLVFVTGATHHARLRAAHIWVTGRLSQSEASSCCRAYWAISGGDYISSLLCYWEKYMTGKYNNTARRKKAIPVTLRDSR